MTLLTRNNSGLTVHDAWKAFIPKISASDSLATCGVLKNPLLIWFDKIFNGHWAPRRPSTTTQPLTSITMKIMKAIWSLVSVVFQNTIFGTRRSNWLLTAIFRWSFSEMRRSKNRDEDRESGPTCSHYLVPLVIHPLQPHRPAPSRRCAS